MKKFIYFIFLPLVAAVTGCASSKITSSWRTPDAIQTPVKKIMVVGLIRESERAMKEQLEEHMIEDLNALGYTAVSAYKEIGPKAFQHMDEKSVLEKLKNSNVDAVITIVLLNKQRERLYRPATIIQSPYAVYSNRFWGYYSTLSDRIYSPGYYETTTRYFWESNMYCLCDKALLYSSQTQSFDPSSAGTLGHEYGKMIVHDMLKKKILVNSIKKAD
ncbi:MAG: hypothetical protein U0V75_10530 [Ferruginibacter sp.]